MDAEADRTGAAHGPLLIRPGRTAERVALEALQWRATLANPGDHAALRAHPEAIELPDEQLARGCVQVAERGGRVLGFAVLRVRPDTVAELDGLFVEPDAWRGGVGRALVRRCVAEAYRQGARTMDVVADPQAQAFYAALGFDMVGPVPTRFGPAVAMRLARLGRSC